MYVPSNYTLEDFKPWTSRPGSVSSVPDVYGIVCMYMWVGRGNVAHPVIGHSIALLLLSITIRLFKRLIAPSDAAGLPTLDLV